MIGSMFSGIGGLDLAVEHVFQDQIAWHAEIEPYCRAVLRKHWPDVPCFEKVQEIDEHASKVDIICAGFPCGDTSQAGKRVGITGARSGLWKQVVRVVRLLGPTVVVVENVAGLLVRGMGDVLGDLADIGFDAEWSCLRAADVGAPHLRRRVFIVAIPSALSDTERGRLRLIGQRYGQQHEQPWTVEPRDGGGEGPRQTLADSGDDRRSRSRKGDHDDGDHAPGHVLDRCHAWPPALDDADAWARWSGPRPGVRRSAYGSPGGLGSRRRRARVRSLGNAVVPQQAAAAIAGLLQRF